MKHLSFYLSALLLSCALNLFSVEKYTWKQYGISFEVPESGLIITNDAKSFVAKWSDFKVKITIIPENTYNDRGLKEFLQKKIKTKGLFSNNKITSFTTGALDGMYIVGYNKANYYECNATLVDRKTDLLIYTEISFDEGLDREVENLLNSFSCKRANISSATKPKPITPKPAPKPAPVAPKIVFDKFTWDQHGFSFLAPNDGKVNTNTENSFKATWKNLTVNLSLFDASGADTEYMKEQLKVFSSARGMNNMNIKSKKVKSFDVYYIQGMLPSYTIGYTIILVSRESQLGIKAEINCLNGKEALVESMINSFEEATKSSPDSAGGTLI